MVLQRPSLRENWSCCSSEHRQKKLKNRSFFRLLLEIKRMECDHTAAPRDTEQSSSVKAGSEHELTWHPCIRRPTQQTTVQAIVSYTVIDIRIKSRANRCVPASENEEWLPCDAEDGHELSGIVLAHR